MNTNKKLKEREVSQIDNFSKIKSIYMCLMKMPIENYGFSTWDAEIYHSVCTRITESLYRIYYVVPKTEFLIGIFN